MAQTSSFVPCLTWIRRGVAKAKPEQVVVTQEELKKIIEEAKEELKSSENSEAMGEDFQASTSGHEAMDIGEQAGDADTDDVVDKYGFDDYDNSDEEDHADDPSYIPGLGGAAYYSSNNDDPYITLKGGKDSDDEDLEVKPDDNMLAVARVKENENVIEFFVYNEANDDLFVHHDTLLTSFPLCLEWMDYKPNDGEKGNYIAIGGMEPSIEIWDVDVLNALEPMHVLGQRKSKKKKSSKKSKGHSDAILDLAWNKLRRVALASASADETIGLWDLETGKMSESIAKHSDKVQTLDWHPTEAQTLLSGGYDKRAIVYDCRDHQNANRAWKVNGEVEKVLWNKFKPGTFMMSTDQGFVYMGDMRSDKVLFTISAHAEACTGLAMSNSIPELLVTVSSDHTAKAWDIANNQPKMVHEQSLKQGDVHCIGASPDSQLVFAAGCQKDLKLWNWAQNKAVMQHFQNRSVDGGGDLKKGGTSKSSKSK